MNRKMGWIKIRFPQSLIAVLVLLVATHSWPVAAQPIVDLLKADDNLTIFVNALEQSDLLETLERNGPFIVFAATDSAMKNEGSAFLLETVLLTKSNRARLIKLLSYHIVPGPHAAFKDIAAPMKLNTLASSCLSIDRMGSALKVGPESFVTGSVSGDNGTIYFIDRLLWEPYESSKCWPKLLTNATH